MNRWGHRAATPPPPATYEMRIGGHLDDHWAAWFEDLALTRESDGTTTLRGHVADQARLHGLLGRVRDLGATLISVQAIDDRQPGDPPPAGRASERARADRLNHRLRRATGPCEPGTGDAGR